MIVKLLKPGGSAYLDIYTLDKSQNSFFRNILQNIYALTNIKIGHLLPPKGKIPNLFLAHKGISISNIRVAKRNERFIIFKDRLINSGVK